MTDVLEEEDQEATIDDETSEESGDSESSGNPGQLEVSQVSDPLLPPAMPSDTAPKPGEPLLPPPAIPAPRKQYGAAMALDWQGTYNTLSPDQKRAVDQASQNPDDPEGEKKRFVNSLFMAERSGKPNAAIANNYESARASFAELHGWGVDAGSDDSKFHAKVVERSTAERDEETAVYGIKTAPVLTTPDSQYPDTEAVAKSREESLVSRAYWSAAEESKPEGGGKMGLLMGGVPDMTDDFFKFEEQNKKNLLPENLDERWKLWQRIYAQGKEDRSKANEAAYLAFPLLARGGDVDGVPTGAATQYFRDLTPDQRRLAMVQLNEMAKDPKSGGGQEGVETRNFGEQMITAAGRTQKNIWQDFDAETIRQGIQNMKFSEGDQVSVYGDGRSGADFVHGRLAERFRGLGDTEGSMTEAAPTATLTKGQATEANKAVAQMKADQEIEHELRTYQQTGLNSMRRDTIPQILAQTFAESAPIIAYTATPLGAPVRFMAYKHNAYLDAVAQGIDPAAADVMAPFTAAAQVGFDQLTFGALTKNPLIKGFVDKYATSAVTRAGLRLIGHTAGATAAQEMRAPLAAAFVQDFAHVMDGTIPGTDWQKVGKQMGDSLPETMVNMMALSAFGVGHAHAADFKGPGIDVIARDPKALAYLGFRDNQIENVVAASKDGAGIAFMEEFKRRSPEANGDSKYLTPAGAAELAKKAQAAVAGIHNGEAPHRYENPPEINNAEAPSEPENLLQTSLRDQFPDATDAEIHDLEAQVDPDFQKNEAEANKLAAVKDIFRDPNGWHLEMDDGAIHDAGSIDTALQMRDELAAKGHSEAEMEANQAAVKETATELSTGKLSEEDQSSAGKVSSTEGGDSNGQQEKTGQDGQREVLNSAPGTGAPTETAGEAKSPVSREEGASAEKPTNISNAEMDEQAKLAGVEPSPGMPKWQAEEMRKKAEATAKENPGAAQGLVDSLKKENRTLSPEETFLLGHEKIRLSEKANELLATRDDPKKSQAARDIAAVELRINEDDQQELRDISKLTGAASGSSLGARSFLFNNDISLSDLRSNFRDEANGGKPLNEKQEAEIKRLHGELAASKAREDALTANAEEHKAALEAEKARKKKSAVKEGIEAYAAEEKAKGKAARSSKKNAPKDAEYYRKLKESGLAQFRKGMEGKSGAGFAWADPDVVAGAVKVVAGLIGEGYEKIKDFIIAFRMETGHEVGEKDMERLIDDARKSAIFTHGNDPGETASDSIESARGIIGGSEGAGEQASKLREQFPAESPAAENEVGFGGEVTVFHSGGRVFKVTHKGEYGLMPVMDKDASGKPFLDAMGRNGTPAEFLERARLSNELFGDDQRFEGVTPDGRMVVSQPFIKGGGPAQAEVDHFLEHSGFVKVPGDEFAWLSPETGALLTDAHTGNFVKDGKGNILPVDTPLMIPEGRMRQYLEEKTGYQRGDIPLRDDGEWKGVGHNYTIMTPGAQTTLSVPEGTTRAEIKQRASDKVAQFRSGVLADKFRGLKEDALQKISDLQKRTGSGPEQVASLVYHAARFAVGAAGEYGIKGAELAAHVIKELGEFAKEHIKAIMDLAEALQHEGRGDEIVKEVGDSVARADDFQKRVNEAGEKAAKEASDKLIKEVGAEAAKGEDFQKRLEKQAQEAGDAARKEASDKLIEEYGQRAAADEDFQKKLEAQAAKADADEARHIANLKKAIERRTSEVEKRTAAGDFAPKPKKEPLRNAELDKARADLEAAKLNFERYKEHARLEARSTPEKIIDTLAQWKRTAVLMSATVYGKLATAAAELFLLTPLEDLVGGALGQAPGLREVAKGAPRHGRFDFSAQADAVVTTWKHLFTDAKSIMKHGKTEIDLLHGKTEAYDMDRGLAAFVGRTHYLLKSPAKRAEFERSFETRAHFYAKRGHDVSEPLWQTRIAEEACADANRQIFMEDNIVSKGWQNTMAFLLRHAEKLKKEGHDVPALGVKLIQGLLKWEIPIVRIPTNIVFRTFEYLGGVPKGLVTLGVHLCKGMDKMTFEQKDIVMRNLKRGSLGAAFFAIGLFNPQAIGGYYAPGRKPGEDEPDLGEVRIGGWNVPKWMVHNPLLEALQFGATVAHVMDQRKKRGSAETKGAGEAGKDALSGLLEEVPLINTAKRDTEALFGHEKKSFLGEEVRGAIPGIVQQAARGMDPRRDKKGKNLPLDPEGFIQTVETGIPKLRENVPVKKGRR